LDDQLRDSTWCNNVFDLLEIDDLDTIEKAIDALEVVHEECGGQRRGLLSVEKAKENVRSHCEDFPSYCTELQLRLTKFLSLNTRVGNALNS